MKRKERDYLVSNNNVQLSYFFISKMCYARFWHYFVYVEFRLEIYFEIIMKYGMGSIFTL